MIKTSAFVAAAILVGVTTAANAKEMKGNEPVSVTVPPSTRICVKQPAITGSMLSKTTCKTAEQWQKEGVNPADLIAGKN